MKNNIAPTSETLQSKLSFQPQELKFGTSGRRGEVIHLTQLEVYINALAELEYLQSLPTKEGGIVKGDEFFYGYDLRPSSSRYVPEQQGRGELAQTIEQVIRDAGLKPVNLGQIPTPALAYYAFTHGKGSIMITGSHIPFDRNGYKTNTSIGELLKEHESPIQEKVDEIRRRLNSQPFNTSLFDENGRFKSGHQELMPQNNAAYQAYISRYVDFFGDLSLQGLRVAVYQHSAVGRDLLKEILSKLGAEVVAVGRSETFIPIDTENMDEVQIQSIQALHDETFAHFGRIDAIISTDGDSDRPMILGVEAGKVRFFGGDLVGMVTAEFLGADAVVVPISCNDAIDISGLQPKLAPKTRIGSPFVVAGMEKSVASGKQAVCGFEANGGFLTASTIIRNGKSLTALPTRDALLPILAVLYAAREKGLSLCQLFNQLPARYSRSALLKAFPRSRSQQIIKRFSLADERVMDVRFGLGGIELLDENNFPLTNVDALAQAAENISAELKSFFTPDMGFGFINRINYLDGVRIYFDNGDVAHIRPSGNADELRIYAVANTVDRAETIVKFAIAEPDGILRCMERLIDG